MCIKALKEGLIWAIHKRFLLLENYNYHLETKETKL